MIGTLLVQEVAAILLVMAAEPAHLLIRAILLSPPELPLLFKLARQQDQPGQALLRLQTLGLTMAQLLWLRVVRVE